MCKVEGDNFQDWENGRSLSFLDKHFMLQKELIYELSSKQILIKAFDICLKLIFYKFGWTFL